jgi:nicotianamine synthase
MATLTKEAADGKLKSVSFPDSHTETVTPPRTPTATAVSARTLMSEIRSIHHALTELPNLKPGTQINALLTQLVSLCVVPYSSEFTTYFFNIDGATELCEQLRPLCAAAEGELESYWAQTITATSISSKGNTLLHHYPAATLHSLLPN